MQPADPAPLRAALIHLTRALGLAMKADFLSRYLDLEVDGEYRYHPLDAGKRALRNQCLRYLTAAGSATAIDLALKQFEHAGNMTERYGALAALVQSDAPARVGALEAFHQRYLGDALVLDKWFQLQAGAWRWSDAAPDTLAQVQALMANPAFSLSNPNKVYALLGGYFKANPAEFHRADGAGYAFWAEQVIALDRNNPQVASRMARALEGWRKFARDPGAHPPGPREGSRHRRHLARRGRDRRQGAGLIHARRGRPGPLRRVNEAGAVSPAARARARCPVSSRICIFLRCGNGTPHHLHRHHPAPRRASGGPHGPVRHLDLRHPVPHHLL
jgi:aminopeptidase N